jgi:mono/diheme cytochrome c family protein
MSGNDIILGVFALNLVVFSLIVALVIPRRDPRFPGKYLRLFVVVSVLLVAGMLTAVEVIGGEEEHGAEAAVTETEAQTETGGEATGPTETGGGGGDGSGGDPAAGRQVFTGRGCGSCHTLQAAGTDATIGPNLDEGLSGKDAAFIQESIVTPDAVVTEGFSPDLMPEDYGEQLSEEELANLVAFLLQSAQG